MIKKVEGIIIRTNDYGETNKIVTMLTRELGKIGVMARGAKKPNSRLSAISQIFTHGYFLIRTSSGLGTLEQGEVISSMKYIKGDITMTAFASYIVELTDKAVEEKNTNPYIFELLFQTLDYINEGLDIDVVTMIYELKMLQVLGLFPHLNSCVSCHEVEGRFSFSVREGGFICHRCKTRNASSLDISPATVRLLRLFYTLDMRRIGSITVKAETKKELKEVITQFYDEYSGLALKSKKFLKQLDKLNMALVEGSETSSN